MTGTLELCQAILRLGPEEEVDYHAEKELKRAFLEYKAAPKKALAGSMFLVNGKEYGSLLEALVKEKELENAGIRFLKPNLKENWDYNTPTKTIFVRPWKFLFFAILIYVIEEFFTVAEGLNLILLPVWLFPLFEMIIVILFIYMLLIQREHIKNTEK